MRPPSTREMISVRFIEKGLSNSHGQEGQREREKKVIHVHDITVDISNGHCISPCSCCYKELAKTG